MSFQYGTTIDNPPPFNETDAEYQSSIGKAINRLRQGHRIPMDVAQELMEEGIDLPALEAHYSQGA
jgi:hypothetical protein